MKHLLRTLLLAAIGGAALFLSAADTNPALEELARRATLKNHPDADAVVLRDISHSTYQPDGTGTDLGEIYVKILTERGKRDFRTVELSFREGFTTAAVELLEVISPDGRRRTIDLAGKIAVVTDNSSNASNIYSPDEKVLTAAVPDLEIGDILHWKIRYTTVKPRIPGHWSSSYLLQDRYPVYEAEVEIDAPKSRPLRTAKVLNPTGAKIERSSRETGDRIVSRWRAKDVPMILNEPNMPPLGAVAQRLVANTAASWDDLSRWFYAIQEKHLAAVNPAMKATVAELVRDAKTPEEKIESIFRFVTRRIRYLGITNEDHAPGMEPHDVSLTFDRRHGVCRDKAALLVAMLRLAGFKAWPVGFLMQDLRLDPATPEWRFDHEIAAVENPDGSFTLMDPTNASGKAMLPEWMNNRNYLPFTPNGGKLGLTGVPDAARNTLKITTKAALSPDGTLSGTTDMFFLGVNDNYRRAFMESPEHLRTEYFGRQLKRVLPGAELASLEILPKDLRDLSRPLKIRLGFRLTDALPPNSATAALPLPEFGRRLGFIHRLLARLEPERRRYNCKFSITAAVDETYSIALPKERPIFALPGEEQLDAPGLLSWKRGFRFADGVLTGYRRIALHTVEATPQQYGRMREFLAAIANYDRTAPILKLEYDALTFRQQAETFPDSPCLTISEQRRITLGADGRSWEERVDFERKILNRHGVNTADLLQFAFHPAEESVTVSAEVVRPDGTRLALSDKEINLLDDDAYAAAPRYPKGKLLVAALPGIEPGSVIRGTVIRKLRDQSFFSHTELFADFSPSIYRKLTVVTPPSFNLRIGKAPQNIRADFHRELSGSAVYTWEAGTTAPVPVESDQPPAELFLPQLRLSCRGYREYADRLNAVLSQKLAADAPEVRKLMKRLTASLPPAPKRDADRELIRVIRDFVARNIRTAGPALNAMPPEFLSTPDVTLTSGYGNSADCALLLAAMLRCRGIACRFVAASSIPFLPETLKYYKDFPVDIFDELLVYLPEHGIYLNDTDEYAFLGDTSHENALAFDLESRLLTAVMPAGGHASQILISNTIRIGSNGSATIRRRQEFAGADGAKLRKKLQEQPAEERRRFVEEITSRISPAAKIDGEPQFRFDRHPVTIEWSIKVAGFVSRYGNCLVFDLPGFDGFARSLRCAEEIRRTPYWRPTAFDMIRKYEITLPVGCHAPRRIHSREWGRFGSALYRENSDFSGEQLDLHGHLTLPAEFVKPADYPEITRLQHLLGSTSARTIIIPQHRVDALHPGAAAHQALQGKERSK